MSHTDMFCANFEFSDTLWKCFQLSWTNEQFYRPGMMVVVVVEEIA